MLLKKKLVAAVAVAIGLNGVALAASQDVYPARDIELVVPYSAGGSVDAMARHFARELARILNASIVVQNRDGAGGTIGVAAVATAAPDGYTVLFSPSSPLTQAPFLMGAVPYKVEDIQPICQIFENPFVIAVRKDSAIASLDALLARARENPAKVSFGHAGMGSVPHLATASLAQAARVDLMDIAFRGDSQVLPQVLGGHVDFAAIGASNVAGKDLKVLAVLGMSRLAAFPEAPAVSEAGVRDAIVARNGLYVRRDAPDAVKQKLAQACKAATESEAFGTAAGTLYQEVRYMDSTAFDEQLQRDRQVNRKLIEDLGLLKQ